MERAEIISQILAILEDVAEVSPEDVNENSVLMDDLDLSSMEILTIVADLEETFGLRIPQRELVPALDFFPTEKIHNTLKVIFRRALLCFHWFYPTFAAR